MTAKIVITLLTAAILVGLEVAGALKGSVGGAFAVLLVLLVAALVAGIWDAWSMGRGVVGWIVSLVVAVGGVVLGAMVNGVLMEAAIGALKLQGKPGPVFLVLTVAVTMSGAWLALWIVNRFR